MFDTLKRVEFIYRFTDMYHQEQKVLKILHNFTHSVIVSRKQELATESEKVKQTLNTSEENEMGIKKKTAFLDLLLQSSVGGQPLSNEDIREEVDTFMFEVRKLLSLFESVSKIIYLKGHDTTTR